VDQEENADGKREFAPLSDLRKEHKMYDEENMSPLATPVCVALTSFTPAVNMMIKPNNPDTCTIKEEIKL